ncbi:MAG: hypothetical protein ACFB10_10545 [Salibacteraceae bacterium]
MPHLLSPLQLKSVQLKNRIVASLPHSQRSSAGKAGHFHLMEYARQAENGSGLVLTETAAVEPEGRKSSQDLGIWSDDHLPGLQKMVQLALGQGAVPGIRIGHAGITLPADQKKWLPPCERLVAPLDFKPEDLTRMVQRFGEASFRAAKAGFQALELQANEGDLMHQMLSGLLNHRTDAYGGDFANRTRFLKQVVHEVKKNWPNQLPLALRLAATDYSDCQESWQLTDALSLTRELGKMGIDVIIPSGGGLNGDAIRNTPANYQVSLSWAIRKQGYTHTGTLGVPIELTQANRVVSQEMADLVVVADASFQLPAYTE